MQNSIARRALRQSSIKELTVISVDSRSKVAFNTLSAKEDAHLWHNAALCMLSKARGSYAANHAYTANLYRAASSRSAEHCCFRSPVSRTTRHGRHLSSSVQPLLFPSHTMTLSGNVNVYSPRHFAATCAGPPRRAEKQKEARSHLAWLAVRQTTLVLCVHAVCLLDACDAHNKVRVKVFYARYK
jgi:hypothetical protein